MGRMNYRRNRSDSWELDCPICGAAIKEIDPETGAHCMSGHRAPWKDGRLDWGDQVNQDGHISPNGHVGHVDHVDHVSTVSYKMTRLSEVQPEVVRWIWKGRVPRGKATMLDADPGMGKSAVTHDIAARISTGRPLPDNDGFGLEGPAGVLFISAEDGIADTIRPRIETAGGDLTRISVLEAIHNIDARARLLERVPRISDLAAIKAAIDEIQAAVLIVDPVSAHLPEGVHANSDQEVRDALQPLLTLAAKKGVAVILVRHLNKNSEIDKALYRGGGSIALIAAARSGLVIAPDPDDPSGNRRILASSKCNLAARPSSLAYHLEPTMNDSVRVVWDGPSSYGANALLSLQGLDDDEQGALFDAKDFLRSLLAGGKRRQTEVMDEAKTAGIAEKTLRRAKKSLGVKSEKGIAEDTAWFWALPKHGQDGQVGQDVHRREVGHVGPWPDSPCLVCEHVDYGPSARGSGFICLECQRREAKATAGVS